MASGLVHCLRSTITRLPQWLTVLVHLIFLCSNCFRSHALHCLPNTISRLPRWLTVLVRFYYPLQQLPLISYTHHKDAKPPTLDLVWAPSPPPGQDPTSPRGGGAEGPSGGRAKLPRGGAGVGGPRDAPGAGVKQTVTIFTRVECSLVAGDQPLKWNVRANSVRVLRIS